MNNQAELPLEVDCRSVSDGLASKDLVLVDCRENDEHQLVHIAGARLMPLGQLAERLAELEPYRNERIVVHCHHGGRSLRAATWLREQGFPKAQSMAGGIDSWAVEIDPSLPRY